MIQRKLRFAMSLGAALLCYWHMAAIADDQAEKSKEDPSRVVVYSEDFEGEFPPAEWRRMGTVKENITQFSGDPKQGKHSVRFQGSPLADMEKWNGSIRCDVSTVGYRKIEVSVSLGAKLDHPTEILRALCNPIGWYGKGKWHDLKLIKGGEEECDGKLRSYQFSLPEVMENQKDFELLFVLYAADSPEDRCYIDDVVITGENADGERETLFADDFEQELSDKWLQYNNIDPKAKAEWYAGDEKNGKHSVRIHGSPATNEDDFDCYFERIISTEGYEDIELSLSLGTSGIEHPTESILLHWTENGFYEKPFHLLQQIKGSDEENDGKLHRFTFRLTEKAADNPKFTIHLSFCGTNGPEDFAYLDDIVITGRKIAGK